MNTIALTNARFHYNNFNKPFDEHGVDFTHLCLSGLNLDCSDFYRHEDTSFVNINRLWLKDCSGFVLDTLSARVQIHEHFLAFDTLLIKTPTSRVTTDQLAFLYDSFDDFDDFEEKVIMKSKLDMCTVDMDDIAYFAPELWGINRTVMVTSKVQGTVEDLHLKKLELYLSDQSFVKGNISLMGVSDVESMFVTASFDEFRTNRKELVNFELPPFDGTNFIEIPGNYNKLGEVLGAANYTGTSRDFVAYGTVHTDVGNISTDIRFHIDTTTGHYRYQGDLVTDNFHAGTFYDVPGMGIVDMNVAVDAFGLTIDDLQAKLKGEITRLVYNDYLYRGIKLDGTLHKDYFNGDVNVKDENLDLSFDGKVNFAKSEPVFDFKADIRKANLAKLNLADRDSSGLLSVRIDANATGSNLDNFEGKLRLSDLHYFEKGKNYDLSFVDLSATHEKDSTKVPYKMKGHIARKELILDCELLHAEVNGKYKFEDLPTAIVSVISNVLPSFFNNQKIKLKQDQEFEYNILLKDMTYISELFVPEMTISNNVEIDGRFNSAENIFKLKSKDIGKFTFNDIELHDFSINARNNEDYLQITTKVNRIVLTDTLNMQNFRLDGELYQDRMAATINWANPDSISNGNIAAEGKINGPQNFELDLKPSYMRIDGKTWSLGVSSHIEVAGKTIKVDDFNIFNGHQSLSVSGVISEERNDMLNIDICSFDLANLNPIIGSKTVKYHGTLNGNGFVADVYHNIFFASDVKLDSFYVNQDYLGDFNLVNLWDNENKRIRVNGELVRKEAKNVQFSGFYYTERENDNIDFVFNLDETNLIFLNAFLPEDVSDLRGLATGQFTLKGSVKEPKVKGKVNFENGAVKINMLNTEYYFGGEVKVIEDMIAFDNIPLSDVKGNLGSARGTFYHKNFSDWNFDCNVEFKKLLCLNTTEEMNPLYYGRAYATGDLNVFAYGNNVEIEVNAKAEKGTKIVLPLYGTEDQTVQDFVRFVLKDSVKTKKEDVDLSGITMNFNFDITPDAEVQIVFDKLAGDMMRGRGAGHIQMEIDRFGEFTMYGQYVVEQGDYLFTLMNVINKRFTVKKGSTISWYGDPLAADIDLKAIYKVNASLFEIMPVDVAAKYKKNMDVECEMNLKHNLFKPDISFDISVPRGDDEVRSALSVIRASEQEMNRQFFSLLAINKFLPLTNSISNAASNAVTGGKATLSELVSSQMSNWLSQISDEFDVGLNYKPGDEISSDEIAVALSTQFFNDRLTLNTNLGVSKGNSANQNPNQLIGDFNVEYKINEDGTFRIRGFNQTNEFDITRISQSPYTQGVGVYYTEDFDKLGDLKIIKKLKSWFKRKDKKKKKDTGEGSSSSAVVRDENVPKMV